MGNKKGRPTPAFDCRSGNYLEAAASVDAASLEAAFLDFLAFLAFFAGAALVSVLVDDAAGADEAGLAACGAAAKAETANREATRPAINLDISDSFKEKVIHNGEPEPLTERIKRRLTGFLAVYINFS